ncbi:hypothetical protein ACFXO2_11025 [Streptomyces sp. NPDC059152]|uniref:hypothetical protein n=1 Tax=Streptomyces sp. NPDC059152 TaxID=3346742 RepID=UPI0036B22B5C
MPSDLRALWFKSTCSDHTRLLAQVPLTVPRSIMATRLPLGPGGNGGNGGNGGSERGRAGTDGGEIEVGPH